MTRRQTFIGLMTGTSLDGIDISLVDFWEELDTKFDNKFNYFKPFSKKEKEILNGINSELTVQKFGAIQTYYSELLAEAINEFLKNHSLNSEDIRSLGIHGQTVWHETNGIEIDNKNIRFSLQLINAPLIANRTQIPVIYDFRNSDIANGGQGAPLVPIFDQEFFSSNKVRVLVNIGGISNLTYLPKVKSKAIAFDCGPGNVWIDYLANKYFDAQFDNNGELAQKGNINSNLLNLLKEIPYLQKEAPKSTGKETFSYKLLEDLILKSKCENKYDILSTVSYFTADCIIDSINKCDVDATEILIAGGGTKNKFIIDALKSSLSQMNFIDFNELGIDPDFKESIAFSYLAYINFNNYIPEFKHFTGASTNSILGSIVFP